MPKPQGAAVVSPLGLCDPPPPSSSLPRAGAGRVGPILSTREVLSHRLPPFRRPPAAPQNFYSFFVFFFDVVCRPLLNAYFSLLEPQNLPKWSPNPPKIEPKTLPKSILCCERRKMISSKHSHTFAHFCCFQTLQNRPEIVQKTNSNSDLSWTAFGSPKNTIPELFKLAFGSQLGPNLALSWLKSRLK